MTQQTTNTHTHTYLLISILHPQSDLFDRRIDESHWTTVWCPIPTLKYVDRCLRRPIQKFVWWCNRIPLPFSLLLPPTFPAPLPAPFPVPLVVFLALRSIHHAASLPSFRLSRLFRARHRRGVVVGHTLRKWWCVPNWPATTRNWRNATKKAGAAWLRNPSVRLLHCGGSSRCPVPTKLSTKLSTTMSTKSAGKSAVVLLLSKISFSGVKMYLIPRTCHPWHPRPQVQTPWAHGVGVHTRIAGWFVANGWNVLWRSQLAFLPCTEHETVPLPLSPVTLQQSCAFHWCPHWSCWSCWSCWNFWQRCKRRTTDQTSGTCRRHGSYGAETNRRAVARLGRAVGRWRVRRSFHWEWQPERGFAVTGWSQKAKEPGALSIPKHWPQVSHTARGKEREKGKSVSRQ